MIVLIPVLGFAAVILFLRYGIYRLDAEGMACGGGDSPPLSFSVVIAARNEELNIAACLESVFAQNIDAKLYEVIVIDDRSSDATPQLLRDAAAKYSRLRVLTVSETPQGSSPKKHAVSLGIAAASNAIIAFTDADCRVPPTWLACLGKHFDNGTALVQGITSYSAPPAGMNRLFWGLQSVDFLSHGIIAAAAISAKLPINSNANNMAFRKQAFIEIGGYGEDKGVVLGDDDHLLQRVWRSGLGARFMADPRGAVETAPTETPAALLEQRRRWGSVTVHYGARQIALLSAVFIFYVTIVVTAVASIAWPALFSTFMALMFVKLAGELVLMIPGTRIFDKKHLRKYIIPASIIQLPVTLWAVIGGVFGKFTWKGTRTGRTVRAT